MANKETILISKMYNNNSKAYSQQGENIVHEAVNLINSDNGEHNIYIVPSGVIQDTTKREQVSCVLLVRKAAWKETAEVIAKAEDLTYVGKVDTTAKYYGESLTYYFDKNTNGDKQDVDAVNITYKSGKISMPNKRVYLTNDENFKKNDNNSDVIVVYVGKARLLNNSQRLYVDKDNKDVEYGAIKKIIDDTKIWSEPILKTLEEKEKEIQTDTAKGFMHYIGQHYNELAYSNMFANVFMNYPVEFCSFCKEILNIQLSSSFDIKREYNNIDLLINDGANVIVIENKIHSGINGISDGKDGKSQLSKYYSIITENQVSNGVKNNYFFIFAPEYAIGFLKSFIKNKKLDYGDKYKIVSYKNIYEFYKKFETSIKDSNFKEFLLALKPHIKETDNLVEEQMIQRMLKIKKGE